MSPEQSRQFGKALMALSIVQLLLYGGAAVRRSYLAIALPIGAVLAVISGFAFWVGYTMATNAWDDADFGDGDGPIGTRDDVAPI